MQGSLDKVIWREERRIVKVFGLEDLFDKVEKIDDHPKANENEEPFNKKVTRFPDDDMAQDHQGPSE